MIRMLLILVLFVWPVTEILANHGGRQAKNLRSRRGQPRRGVASIPRRPSVNQVIGTFNEVNRAVRSKRNRKRLGEQAPRRTRPLVRSPYTRVNP